MRYITRLENALERRFPREDVSGLARLLHLASEKGKVSYDEIETETGAKEDLLLLLHGERLLLPTRTSQISKNLAWEDRLLITRPRETYEMPNVIRILVRNEKIVFHPHSGHSRCLHGTLHSWPLLEPHLLCPLCHYSLCPPASSHE